MLYLFLCCRMYNHLVESCFDKCVAVGWNGSFSSKQLEDTEAKCVSQCAEKFMKLTQRAGFRFAEFQAQQGMAMDQANQTGK